MITGNTVIGDILDSNPGFGAILLEHGMHCLGCPTSRSETLSEACEVHDINLDELLRILNDKA